MVNHGKVKGLQSHTLTQPKVWRTRLGAYVARASEIFSLSNSSSNTNSSWLGTVWCTEWRLKLLLQLNCSLCFHRLWLLIISQSPVALLARAARQTITKPNVSRHDRPAMIPFRVLVNFVAIFIYLLGSLSRKLRENINFQLILFVSLLLSNVPGSAMPGKCLSTSRREIISKWKLSLRRSPEGVEWWKWASINV